MTQRDTKTDILYIKLRDELKDKLTFINVMSRILQHKGAEYNCCDRPDSECGHRVPLRRTTLVKD